MIESLELDNVGIFSSVDVEWADRLNIVTGDNGLGKSLLLDLAWWALTRTWASYAALPQDYSRSSAISYRLRGRASTISVKGTYKRRDSDWRTSVTRADRQGIVVYVRVDGGFSVWDSARNYLKKEKGFPSAFHFGALQVWEGLDIDGVRVCEGLERDWVSWQKGNDPQFKALCEAIKTLSPEGEDIEPGPPIRVFAGEGRDRPTLKFGNQTIPLILASSGIRRILGLAYLLVWAWHEHVAAAKFLGETPQKRLVLLFDEPETHLHPRWQRTILPSVVSAMNHMRGAEGIHPQIVVATHAALVLASVEPFFDREKDDLMHLHTQDGKVCLDQGLWTKQGDVTNWLVSEVFGLLQARSLAAERAIEEAEAWMRGSDLDPIVQKRIDGRLKEVLPGHDDFWPRWLVETGQVGKRG